MGAKRQLRDDDPNLIPDHLAEGILRYYANFATAVELFLPAMDEANRALKESGELDARLVLLDNRLTHFCMGFEVGLHIYTFFPRYYPNRKHQQHIVSTRLERRPNDVPYPIGRLIDLNSEALTERIIETLHHLVEEDNPAIHKP